MEDLSLNLINQNSFSKSNLW